MNPRSLYWLGKRHKDGVIRREHAVGMICAAIVNHSMNKPQKWAVPSEYMPSEIMKKYGAQPEAGEPDTADAIRELMNSFMG